MKRKSRIPSGFAIRKRLLSLLMVMVMTLGYMPTMAWAAPENPGDSGGGGTRSDGSAPATEKKLIDNGDGTYTLALSVTGSKPSETQQDVHKANVILVIDTSSSMNYDAAAGTQQDPHKYYEVPYIPGNPDTGGVNATYYRQTNTDYAELFYNPNDETWYQNRTGQWNYNYSNPFSGTFYARSRFWAEYHALTDQGGIVDSLLAQNTAENPDIIEIGIASF